MSSSRGGTVAVWPTRRRRPRLSGQIAVSKPAEVSSAPVWTAIVVGHVLLFPLIASRGGESVYGEWVRGLLSLAFFGAGGLGMVVAPRQVLPVIFGLSPVLDAAKNVGAIYGTGLGVFLLFTTAAGAWPLKRIPGARPPAGIVFLVILLSEAVFQAGLQMTQGLSVPYPVLIDLMTFIVIVHFIVPRCPKEFAITIFKAIALGAGLLLVSTVLTEWSGQFLIGTSRLGESLGMNPNVVGDLAVKGLFAVAGVLAIEGKALTFLDSLGFLAGILVILLSASRTAALQFVIVACLVLWMSRQRIAFALVGLALALWIGVVSDLSANVFQSYHYQRVLNFEESERRIALNQLSWDLALENPVFGVGLGRYPDYAEREGLLDPSGKGLGPHNAIAGVAAEFGFVGLAVLALWFMSFIVSELKWRLAVPFGVAAALCVAVSGIGHGLSVGYSGSVYCLIGCLASNYQKVRIASGEDGSRAGRVGRRRQMST